MVISFFLTLVSSISYREAKIIKQRLEDISTFIRILSRGKLSQRMEILSDDDISWIERSLNELADKLEKQVTSLQKLADENATLAKQAKSAATIEERQRLARDLHDAVSQQLFALNMLASAAVKTLSIDTDKAKTQIEEVASIAAKAQGEMRALLLHLRPVHLSGDSLHEGMQKLVQELSEKTDIQFDVSIEDIQGLTKGIEDHLFRIVQESLSNALRHSQASSIKVALYEKSNAVYLKIHDNGKGFDLTKEKKASYGLKTMKERCEEIGGELTLTTQINKGTYIDIRIPIK